ncbi:hypothetical protein [Methanobrevibacter thaueri]|jgi:hypothetical protein|nr:hypothetical protein [Methanobrevibacter thaueri]
MSDKKQVWSLNPIESIAYKGLKQVFIGAYMVNDILDLDKNDDKE